MNDNNLIEIEQEIANMKRETIYNIHHHSMNALAKIDSITTHSDDQRDVLLSLVQQFVTDQATLLHWIVNLDFQSEKLLIANQDLEMLSQSLYILSYLYQIRIKKLMQTHNIMTFVSGKSINTPTQHSTKQRGMESHTSFSFRQKTIEFIIFF